MTNDNENKPAPKKRNYKSDPKLHDYIDRVVAQAPPMTEEQKDSIRALLTYGASQAARKRAPKSGRPTESDKPT
ncbi:hypothetical protein [Williamsia sp.]|uniref:hypothetical protein n=1 Tax=Williamsia sp. TaxID=1872085 RepID=UPI002F95155A